MGPRAVACLAGLALLLGAGQLVAANPPALYAPGNVRLALALPDGSTVLCGDFAFVGETPRAGLAKLEPNGQLDPDWNPSGLIALTALQAVALAASPDGSRVYIATSGTLQAVSADGAGANVPGFAANVSGSVDGGNTGIRALAVAPNGQIYLGGAFAQVKGQARNGLARLGADSALDATWTPAVNSTVAALDLDAASGFLYLGGAFVNAGGAAHLRVARVSLADGAVDATWTPSIASTSDGVHELARSASGDSVIVTGNFTAVNGTARNGIAKIATSNGALDAAWSPALGGFGVEALLPRADYVYLGGELGCCNQSRLVRAAAGGNGALDVAWLPMADAPVRALLPAADGVLAFGAFGYVGAQPALAAAHVAASASADHTLPDVERAGAAYATATEASGSVLVAGDFGKADASYRPGLLRVLPDASLDPAFLPPRFEGGSASRIAAVAGDAAHGRVYAGGTFDHAGGASHIALARLDAVTGALDAGFAPYLDAFGSAASIQAIVVADEGVYLGGAFAHVGFDHRDNLARLTHAGDLDTAFHPTSTNGAVTRLVLGPAGLYAGGTFLSPRERLARFKTSDGLFDAAWNPTFPWTVVWFDFFDLAPIPGGVLASNWVSVPLLGGFALVDELVRIDDAGTATVVARFNQPVFDVLPAPDGASAYLAGLFQTRYDADSFFNQSAHPEGLAQVSLSDDSLGDPLPWPAPAPLTGGVPSLAFIGGASSALLAGGATAQYPFPRTGLELVALPTSDQLFQNGFE